jgi:hypothetical protein
MIYIYLFFVIWGMVPCLGDHCTMDMGVFLITNYDAGYDSTMVTLTFSIESFTSRGVA